jgi:hypothetical protein
MTDATLDVLRRDALTKRINGVGNRVMWSAKDIAILSDHFRSMPEKTLRDDTVTARKPAGIDPGVARRKLAEAGFAIAREMKADDVNFLFAISSEMVDLAGDVVKVAGIDTSNFNKNPSVLNAHNSAELPIATSSAPLVSGTTLTAIARFPAPGVSEDSDRVAASIRAGLVRGASIGFVPIEWSFSKDPSRPFGVDFKKVGLLEWSICSVPRNPSALLVGVVSAKSARSAGDAPAQDDVNWQCCADTTMPVDATDDPFDPVDAKAALLAECSPGGTILDDARSYFLAVDVASPFDPRAYSFPFCRVTDAGIVASKIGWRKSFAAFEKSAMPGTVITDARAIVDALEARPGDVKAAARRREARGIAALAKLTLEDAPPSTREQRLAEAHNLRRMVMDRIRSS